MRRAVFLDRDGTICEEVGYVNHVSRIRLLKESAPAIRRLRRAGFLVIVVTNQAGVAKAYFPESYLSVVHRWLKRELRSRGAALDDVYYCPHHRSGEVKAYAVDCECRKPKPGMLLQAAEKHGIDLTHSYVVGDKIIETEMAKRVDAAGILVKTGYGRGEILFRRREWRVQPDFIAEHIGEAAQWILLKENGIARRRRASRRRAK